VKIAIVNDRPLAIEALRRTLAVKPEHEVIWVAKDGAEAVASCTGTTPDLILMDLIMPGMDGVEATRRIMAATPCPILVVTASVGANANRAFEAMGHGALDAVDTPVIRPGQLHASTAPLLRKIDTIERLLVHKRNDVATRPARVVARSGGSRLVAIGASAGGPSAVAAILRALPIDFPAGIVVIQHVDSQFALGMAEWLNQQSLLHVRVAVDGEHPTPGTVLLAGRDEHLVVNARQGLSYVRQPIECAYRPSIDVFYESVSQHWTGEAVGVLLTGMGRDGALGLKALRNQGRMTMAQDRETSAVYGMPKAAATLHAAVEVLPVDRIADRLIELCGAAAEQSRLQRHV
jgi:two-component system, chemotaxis family, response regulator WspF